MKKSNILLTHSYFYRLDPKQWKNKTPFPPLGTIYAAAILRNKGFHVHLYDTNLRSNTKDFKGVLINHESNYVVIYDDGFNYLTKMCLTNMRAAAFTMIDVAKSLDCTVIINSSDATDHYDKYLDAGADYIIYGEGEMTCPELIDFLEQGTNDLPLNVPGTIFRIKGVTQKNMARRVLKNLDSLSQPAWDLIDIDSYRKVWKESGKTFTLNIATTRGCPFKCNWCAKPIYGNRYNSHSPQYIIDQIKYHKTHHDVSKFWMCDDIFGLKPNWVQEFNRLLKENNLEIDYYIQSRADLLLEADNIQALHDSGASEIWIGAESGSQKILDAMDKGITVKQIYESTQLLRSNGIRVGFFLQFGYTGELWSDIQQTIKMILDLVPDNIGISVSYPLPGTKFYESVKDNLKIKSNWTDSDDLDMMFQNTFSPKFYKTLHRYVHNRYRIKKGMNILTFGDIKKHKFKLVDFARMLHHLPLACLNRILLYNYARS